MPLPTHVLNWFAGWIAILAAFLCGAGIGLFFHSESFLGGYASFRRRIVRLGHISFAALGMINLLFAYSPWPAPGKAASLLLAGGTFAMPIVCFLTGWRAQFRQLFFIPLSMLVGAVVLILLGGNP